MKGSQFEKKIRKIMAILLYMLLILIEDWPGVNGKDEWDNLMKWANSERK